jgi:hypothetical protein
MFTTLRLQRLNLVNLVRQRNKRLDTAKPMVDPAAAERIFHQALHVAYRRFQRQHPEWTGRGFDDRFLRGPGARRLTEACSARAQSARRPTGMDLARQWDRQFGELLANPARIQATAQLAAAAGEFLGWFVREWDALAQENTLGAVRSR